MKILEVADRTPDLINQLLEVWEKSVRATTCFCQIEKSKISKGMSRRRWMGLHIWWLPQVKQNNPKYANRIIKQLKASANPEIKQLYINGHFCYVFKFGIVTNGLGIIRHISFYNKDFIESHPDIVVEKKTDSPDEDKSVHDSKLLVPTLKDFFAKHPLINPKVFLGDAAFDSVQLYKELLSGDTFGIDKHFSKAYILLNSRSHLKNIDYTINDNGIPCCPYDPSLPMKPEGNTSHLRCGLPTFKFVCPKMKYIKCEDGKYHRRCQCDNPCTTSPCGRMI